MHRYPHSMYKKRSSFFTFTPFLIPPSPTLRGRMVSQSNTSRANKNLNPSHVAWSKFFEKHTLIVPLHRGNESSSFSKPPPVSQSGRFSSLGTAPNNKPRRSRSARDLSDELHDARGQKAIRSVDSKYAKQTGLTEAEWEETMKRLRRLILLEGVPGDDVSSLCEIVNVESDG